MKIKNCKTNHNEDIKLIKIIDGLFFYDMHENPLKLENDHIINIGENFYKLKELDKIITEFKNELNSYNNHESKI